MSKFHFRKLSYTPFARLPGFSKGRGHYVPEKSSPAAVEWAKSLLDENAQEELQLIYQRSKDILGLRHRQVRKLVEKGGGAVETDFFRYTFSLSQSEPDPAEVKISREINLLRSLEELPPALDLVFPDAVDEIVAPLEAADFDELVEHFENLRDKWGGKLTDNETIGQIGYTNDFLTVEINTMEGELVIKPATATGCLPLLKIAEEHLATIAGDLPGTPGLS